MQLAPGVIVAGRYRLDRMLGQGGMGSVWAATHAVTQRKVALKLLRGRPDEQPQLRKRFLREARAASLVDHPNVVRIHDVFELEDGTPIIVMDALKGETLGQRLARDGPLSIEEAANVLLPVVSAVGTAHELGVVHRDLKPDNVFLTDESGPAQVKVLDFGIAKLQDDESATMTAHGAILGTPCYMAPEQGFGEPNVDHRADVWAVGTLLYESLSGGRPIEGENLGQVLKRLMEDGIAPLSSVAPDVPDDVASLVDRMLARDRDERLPDLRAAFEVLSRYSALTVPAFGSVGSRTRSSSAEDDAGALPPPDDARPAAPDTAAPHTLPTGVERRRRTMLLAALAATAITAAAIYGSRATSPAPPEPGAAAKPSSQSIASTSTPVARETETPRASPAAPSAEPLITTPSARTNRAAPGAIADKRGGAVSASLGGAPAVPSGAPPAPPASSSATTPKAQKRSSRGGLVEEPPY